MKASEWIDRLKADKGWDSDYRVAQELKVGRAAISRYRANPESTMDEDVAIRVAAELGERPELVLLDQLAERARSEGVRAVLNGLLERERGKVVAAARVGAGGKGRIDISCVTLAGGDPSELHRNTHRIEFTHQAPQLEERRASSEAILLQMLANRLAGAASSPLASHH